MSDAPHQPPTTETEWLLAYVREHHATCPACGHDLGAATTSRCPNCDRRLHISFGTDVSLKWWLMALYPVTLLAGIGLLAFVAFLSGELWLSSPGETVLVGYVLAMVPLAALIVGCRRTFLRQPVRRQRNLAIASCVVAAISFWVLFQVMLVDV